MLRHSGRKAYREEGDMGGPVWKTGWDELVLKLGVLGRKLVWMDREVPHSAVGGQSLNFSKRER